VATAHQAQPARLHRVDDVAERRASVRGHRARRRVHLHAVEPRGADEQGGAVPDAAGAGELRDGVREPTDDLHARPAGAGARDGRDHLPLRRRVRDRGHRAVRAVAGPRAVGIGEHAPVVAAPRRRARRHRERRSRGQQEKEKRGEHFRWFFLCGCAVAFAMRSGVSLL
jgi:hypothetical protein